MKEFIDEYKHLEKLCGEIFDCQHGITQYITEMENTPSSLSRRVPGWYGDLDELKRLRHIRNALVHDTSEIEYDEDDVGLLKDFYERIMNQQDPLSKLHVIKEIKMKAHSETIISHLQMKPQEIYDANHVNAKENSHFNGKDNGYGEVEDEQEDLGIGKAAAVFVITIVVAVGLLKLLFFS